jgi:hypothetical protein
MNPASSIRISILCEMKRGQSTARIYMKITINISQTLSLTNKEALS